MSKRDILRRINRALSPNKVDYSTLDSEIRRLKDSLEETVNVQTVNDVKRQLALFQKRLDFSPLVAEVERLKASSESRHSEANAAVAERMRTMLAECRNADAFVMETLSGEMVSLRESLSRSELAASSQIGTFNSNMAEIREAKDAVQDLISGIRKDMESLSLRDDVDSLVKGIGEKIEDIRRDLLARIGNLGGGSQNRQIKVNGVDYLTRYTDINLKGSITAASNNTTKSVDITFSGGGGGGFTELPATGAVNGSNVTYAFTQVPSYIVADGLWFKPTDSNGNTQWSSVGTTITMINPPATSIYGVA